MAASRACSIASLRIGMLSVRRSFCAGLSTCLRFSSRAAA